MTVLGLILPIILALEASMISNMTTTAAGTQNPTDADTSAADCEILP